MGIETPQNPQEIQTEVVAAQKGATPDISVPKLVENLSTKETGNSWLEKTAKSTASFANKRLMITIATGVITLIGAMGEKEAFAKGKLLDSPQISSQGYDVLEKQKTKLLNESEKKELESIESEFDSRTKMEASKEAIEKHSYTQPVIVFENRSTLFAELKRQKVELGAYSVKTLADNKEAIFDTTGAFDEGLPHEGENLRDWTSNVVFNVVRIGPTPNDLMIEIISEDTDGSLTRIHILEGKLIENKHFKSRKYLDNK